MPRRRRPAQRQILADPLFKSELLSKFINVLMRDGKKSVAERVVYQAFDRVAARMKKMAENKKPAADTQEGEAAEQSIAQIGDSVFECEHAQKVVLDVFKKALENITPSVEVKSRRVGGSNYQVPVPVIPKRRRTLAMRWMVQFAAGRNEKTMVMRLANEILDAFECRGGAYKKREDVHRMAKANQAFAHLVRT